MNALLKVFAIGFIACISWFLLCPKYEYIDVGEYRTPIKFGLPVAERAKQIAKIKADRAANPHPYILWSSAVHFPYECRLFDLLPGSLFIDCLIEGEDSHRLLRVFRPFPIQRILPLSVFFAVFLAGPFERLIRGRVIPVSAVVFTFNSFLLTREIWCSNYCGWFGEFKFLYLNILHLPGANEIFLFQPVIIGTLVYVFWENIKIRQISRLDGNNHTDRY